MSSGWWAQKMAQRGTAPASRPMPSLPGHSAPPPPSWGQPTSTPNAPGSTMTPDGKVHAWDAANTWRGSRGAQQETGRCPECNSGNYFSMANAEGVWSQAAGRVASPKPRCYDCGYPNLQSGSGMGVPGVEAKGEVRAARQNHDTGFRPDVIVGKVG